MALSYQNADGSALKERNSDFTVAFPFKIGYFS
jgi:hypothetical protein